MANLELLNLRDEDLESVITDYDDTEDGDSNGDEDGLRIHTVSEAADKLLSEELEPATTHHKDDFRIDHSFGTFRLTPERFIERTQQADFDGAQALDMLQRKLTINYARRKSGSKPASFDDSHIPKFFLDMISVVGRPYQPITRSGLFFDHVRFSLQYWNAPYTAKYTIERLPFDLEHRTFRLATASTRELWFLVMHPVQGPLMGLPQVRAEQRRRQKSSSRNSALRQHHAEALAGYIKDLFLDGDLLGIGVEPSWALNARRSQDISYDKWELFQRLLVRGWPGFVRQHAHDTFWTENEPAFHTYDYGANIKIEVDEQFDCLLKETPIRDDDYTNEANDGSSSGQPGSDDDESSDDDEIESYNRGRDQADADGRCVDQDQYQQLYTGDLEGLRERLEQKYKLGNVESISYALATNIHCLEGVLSPSVLDETAPTVGEEDATARARRRIRSLCSLADRTKVTEQYNSPRDFTFYPLAFHPRFGNFSSAQPPAFLRSTAAIMTSNMSTLNEGADVLSFGAFQGYSSIKQTIRNRGEDLLATKGIATAALTLPPAEASRNAYLRRKQEQLLRKLRGQGTPSNPRHSTPFAREAERVEACIVSHQTSFRMEQVVTIRASRLTPQRRHFYSVLQPIFQLIRFFRMEARSYVPVLRSFDPEIFPGILRAYARVFELALAEMDSRFRRCGDGGLDVALAEGVAVLDRLGSFCFTGDPRVFITTVLKPLVTIQSIQNGAWPYIHPDVLDLRGPRGSICIPLWPKTADRQPVFAHLASIAFYYGPAVAASRRSQIMFGDSLGRAITDGRLAYNFLKKLFRELWTPQTVIFMACQLRLRLSGAVRDGEDWRARLAAALAAWELCDAPFAIEQWGLLYPPTPLGAGEAGESQVPFVTTMARHDLARKLYEACQSDEAAAGEAFSSRNATWFPLLRGAIRLTSRDSVSPDEWVQWMATAMGDAGIEWMPGAPRHKLSSRAVVRLVGAARPKKLLLTRPGTLKREVGGDEEHAPKRRRKSAVDLGCKIPFERVPRIVVDGFERLDKEFETGNIGVFRHYHLARACLEGLLGDERCDLMLMIVLTFTACSVTPHVAPGQRQFSAAPKKKNPALLAANMVLRMLWFLVPERFPWHQDERGVLNVREMTKKIEHKGVNNRVMRELGWVTVTGNRDSPRNSDCKLAPEEKLYEMRKSLLFRQRDATAFISTVFRSDDAVWVDRCVSIIAER